jgi:hypothetical protein
LVEVPRLAQKIPGILAAAIAAIETASAVTIALASDAVETTPLAAVVVPVPVVIALTATAIAIALVEESLHVLLRPISATAASLTAVTLIKVVGVSSDTGWTWCTLKSIADWSIAFCLAIGGNDALIACLSSRIEGIAEDGTDDAIDGTSLDDSTNGNASEPNSSVSLPC